MKNKIIILIIISGIIISTAGCIGPSEKEEVNNNKNTNTGGTGTGNQDSGSNPPEFVSVEDVITRCIEECKSRKNTEDFTRGPCLSNEIAPGWVCDIAHDPRQDIDNKPENQCSAYREGKAQHFVELDENCDIIKVH